MTIGQAASGTPAGRKLNISDFVFEVPDMAPKPAPARVKFRIDGPVPAAAEVLALDRLSEFSGTLVDPNSSKGTVSAVVTLGRRAMLLTVASSMAPPRYIMMFEGWLADLQRIAW